MAAGSKSGIYKAHIFHAHSVLRYAQLLHARKHSRTDVQTVLDHVWHGTLPVDALERARPVLCRARTVTALCYCCRGSSCCCSQCCRDIVTVVAGCRYGRTWWPITTSCVSGDILSPAKMLLSDLYLSRLTFVESFLKPLLYRCSSQLA